jgi:hypothetical protein
MSQRSDWLGIKIVYVIGVLTNSDNKGCRVWYSVVALGETPPVFPKTCAYSSLQRGRRA